MKKNYFLRTAILLVALLCGTSAWAVSITQNVTFNDWSKVTGSGNSYANYEGDQILPGSDGVDYTWDFYQVMLKNGSATATELQLQKDKGVLTSPIFDTQYGFDVTITFDCSKNNASITETGTDNMVQGASPLTLSVTSTSASITIEAGSAATYIKQIDIKPIANPSLQDPELAFTGITAHAAAAPYAGRSALDAAELMNVGCNYLREHMIPDARLHYAYLDTGGAAPNVVPDHAAVHYYIRAPRTSQMLELFERVNKVAQGAALMTETQMEYTILDACSDFVPNRPLSQLLADCLAQLGGPDFDEADRQLAAQFQQTIPPRQRQDNLVNACLSSGLHQADYAPLVLDDHTPPYLHQPWVAEMGSTDLGDASYCAPTAQCYIACAALGTGGHTWQMTAQANSSIGRKGTIRAAMVLALAGARAAGDPELLRQARQAFEEDVPNGYTCPLPPRQ